MRWQDREESQNVEDRRGMSPKGMAVGGGLGGLLLLVVMAFLSGGDPAKVLEQELKNQQVGGLEGGAEERAAPSPEEEELASFMKVVLRDTEDVWTKLFIEQLGKEYQAPKMVLFTGAVDSACGQASSAVGPFYCPGDHKVYLDLSFFQQLKKQLGAPGDFAQAYVVAHEVGHHIQKLLGTSDQVHAARGQVSQEEYNQLSVRLELQADFYAGVWAHHAQRNWSILEEGDIEEAFNCAQAIGDDKLQREAKGHVRPETFTHGTSKQRMKWFKRGLTTGDITKGDTFGTEDL